MVQFCIVHSNRVRDVKFRRERRRDCVKKSHERIRMRPKSHNRHNRQPRHRAAHRDRGGLQNVIRKGKRKPY